MSRHLCAALNIGDQYKTSKKVASITSSCPVSSSFTVMDYALHIKPNSEFINPCRPD
jgi:hypothetical protein